MSKKYFSLGLMSGTSGDGVDASIIKSDGQKQYETVLDKYFEYSVQIQENIHTLKDKIANSSEKLIEFSRDNIFISIGLIYSFFFKKLKKKYFLLKYFDLSFRLFIDEDDDSIF